MEIINEIDTYAFLWLNALHHPFFDSWIYLISAKWVWVPMYIAILTACIRQWGFKKQFFLIIAMFVVALILTDTSCGSLVRNLIERPRPTNDESGISHLVHTVNQYTGGSFGFPSCHASNSFMLATLCTLLFRFKPLSFFLFGWAILHSYSRIYLGVHYPGDILTGGFLGSLIALGIFRLFNRYSDLQTEKPYLHLNAIIYTEIAIIIGLFIFAKFAGAKLLATAMECL